MDPFAGKLVEYPQPLGLRPQPLLGLQARSGASHLLGDKLGQSGGCRMGRPWGRSWRLASPPQGHLDLPEVPTLRFALDDAREATLHV